MKEIKLKATFETECSLCSGKIEEGDKYTLCLEETNGWHRNGKFHNDCVTVVKSYRESFLLGSERFFDVADSLSKDYRKMVEGL